MTLEENPDPLEAPTYDEEALHGRPVDDVLELGERLRDLPRYIELARPAFQQRGLT
jgi:hypothetical protein